MQRTLVPDEAFGREIDPARPHQQGRYRLNDVFSTLWLSEAVVTCTRLRLPDAVDAEPVSVEHLARECSLQPQALYRLLRALAANGIFEELPDGRFRHTELSRQLREDHPYSYAPMARLWGHPHVRRSWEAFPQSIGSGRSGITEATGQTLYERLQLDEGLARAFNEAMVSNSRHASESLARRLDVAGAGLVVDLAGGVGGMLAILLKSHPQLRGIVYDLAYLEQPARAFLSACELGGRATFEAGDFTRRVPEGADIYLVKNTLWNFDDEVVGQILAQVRHAMSPSAAFYIVEYMLEAENSSWTTLWDLQMLNLPGGRARTVEEYRTLLAQAGLELHRRMTVEDQVVLCAKAKP